MIWPSLSLCTLINPILLAYLGQDDLVFMRPAWNSLFSRRLAERHLFIEACWAVTYAVSQIVYVNTLRPRQSGHYFPDDIFKCIFLKENVWIPIKISLKFVPKSPINNIPALVQIMAWRRPDDKPLSEPMLVRLLMHICATRPQWFNSVAQGKIDIVALYPGRWNKILGRDFYWVVLNHDLCSVPNSAC